MKSALVCGVHSSDIGTICNQKLCNTSHSVKQGFSCCITAVAGHKMKRRLAGVGQQQRRAAALLNEKLRCKLVT